MSSKEDLTPVDYTMAVSGRPHTTDYQLRLTDVELLGTGTGDIAIYFNRGVTTDPPATQRPTECPICDPDGVDDGVWIPVSDTWTMPAELAGLGVVYRPTAFMHGARIQSGNSPWFCPACGRQLEPVDPMDRIVDGLMVRDCLRRYQANLRELDSASHKLTRILYGLTPPQLEAARLAWSTELKRKVAETRERERNQIVCERDEDGL